MALKRLPIQSCELPATLQTVENILLHTIAMEEDELHLHLVYARVLGASHVCLLVENHRVDLFKHFQAVEGPLLALNLAHLPAILYG